MERKKVKIDLPYRDMETGEDLVKTYQISFISNYIMDRLSEAEEILNDLKSRDPNKVAKREEKKLYREAAKEYREILLEILEENKCPDPVDEKFLHRQCEAKDVFKFVGECAIKDISGLKKKDLEAVMNLIS